MSGRSFPSDRTTLNAPANDSGRSDDVRARDIAQRAHGARRWFSPEYAPDAAVVERGRLEVRLGAGVMLASMVVMTAATVMVAPGPITMRVLAAGAGTVIWQGIVTAGLLVGSRAARAISIASGVVGVLVALSFATAMLRGVAIPPLLWIGVGGGALAFAIGSSLATLSPAARTWHRLQDAARKVKGKAKSLAEWRGDKALSASDHAPPPG